MKVTNILVYGVQNRLEKLLNDSNDSNQNNINDLEIKLTKDFQLKFDRSNELNQDKIILLEKQLNDTNNMNDDLKLEFDKSIELNKNKLNELEKKQTGI